MAGCMPNTSIFAFAVYIFASLRGCNVRAFSAACPSSNASVDLMSPVVEALETRWISDLSQETEENFKRSKEFAHLTDLDENRTQRPVYNGHFVLVAPTGLPDPKLVLHSPGVADLLKLSKDQIHSDGFRDWVSGNTCLGESWATPYALSIMGNRYTSNCPYGTGDGYGDGRAISIGDLHGYELQIKGAGRTPFCRGGDGRAVLRSSIREFLASEAMHYLGVSTTRAVSLVVSEKELVQRPWYREDDQQAQFRLPFQEFAPSKRRRDVMDRDDPNILISEKTAMTTRVSPSFARVGHLDLFARRAELKSVQNVEQTDARFDTSTREWQELEAMIWHTCLREYKEDAYDPYIESKDLAGAVEKLLELAADGIATMTANWVRVGFVQGNFNADNCLVAGRTMDYGPFGWVEAYHPLYAKWTGSGKHFGFMNQPSAGFANYQVLVESVVPVMAAALGVEDLETLVRPILEDAQDLFALRLAENLRRKMGFSPDSDAADDLWDRLDSLLLESRADWTIFFRQLTTITKDFHQLHDDPSSMLEILEGNEGQFPGSSSFYEPLSKSMRNNLVIWLKDWSHMLSISEVESEVYERMRLSNPKYVLREWMMVDAYAQANDGDYDELLYLFDLIQRPYDEGTAGDEARFYRRASEEALKTGGTAFMS